MCLFSRLFVMRSLGISALCLLQLGGHALAAQLAGSAATPTADSSVKVLLWTDQGEYSIQKDSLLVSVSLENAGDEPVYVDRRMFWTGLGGGLDLQIRDENGDRVPIRGLSDALMPVPKAKDPSLLVRLDPGFFYGTSIRLSVKDLLPKPGRYAIRVVYKSWLRRESVERHSRHLPAIWEESPQIASSPLWIAVRE